MTWDDVARLPVCSMVSCLRSKAYWAGYGVSPDGCVSALQQSGKQGKTRLLPRHCKFASHFSQDPAIRRSAISERVVSRPELSLLRHVMSTDRPQRANGHNVVLFVPMA